MSNQPAKIVKIFSTAVWIESDLLGSRHVMRQHEGDEPFTYCSFHYNYAHTSNAQTLDDAERMARALGATDPIEHRSREFKQPTLDEAKKELQAITDYIKAIEEEGGDT